MTQVTAQWQVSSKKIGSKIKSGGGGGGGVQECWHHEPGSAGKV